MGDVDAQLRKLAAELLNISEDSREAREVARAWRHTALPLSELITHGWGHVKVYIDGYKYQTKAAEKTYPRDLD